MKRIFIVLFSACLLIASNFEVMFANNYTINLPSDDYATIAQFTQKRTITAKYDIGKTLDSQTISNTEVVGYCHVYLGQYRANQKYDGKYYDAVLIKCAMEPRRFQSESGRYFYGFSEKLNLQLELLDYETYQGNSPTNATTGSTSYSFGISGGYKEAAVSGSVNLKSAYCAVTDKSSVSENLFDITYDYKPSVLDFIASSERNVMLFEQTWQYATCEWTTSHANHTKYIKVNVDFGVSQSKHAGYASPFAYIVDQPAGYNLRYSNSMK